MRAYCGHSIISNVYTRNSGVAPSQLYLAVGVRTRHRVQVQHPMLCVILFTSIKEAAVYDLPI